MVPETKITHLIKHIESIPSMKPRRELGCGYTAIINFTFGTTD